MIVNILLLIVGFIILIKSADYFVDGASSLAINLKISPLIIGLLVVGCGTSLPELSVSINAHLSNSADMLLGNIIGSNIMNILLILGITLLIYPVKVDKSYVKKDMPFIIFLSIILSILFLDTIILNSSMNILTRTDGFILFVIFLLYIIYTMLTSPKMKSTELPKFNTIISIMITLTGVLGIVFGSNIVVANAINVADTLGISGKIIGLTVIAFGTSLPELITAITAAKKGETDLLLGNIIGSNIFNISIILGLPIAIFGDLVVLDFNYIDIAICLAAPLLMWLLSLKSHSLGKKDGIVLLSLFIIYYALVIFRA